MEASSTSTTMFSIQDILSSPELTEKDEVIELIKNNEDLTQEFITNPRQIELCSRTRDKLDPIATYLIEYLSKINKHDRDDRIEFIEEGHIYKIDGNVIKLSCTGLVKRFFPAFDPDRVIKGIKASSDYKNGFSPYSNMTDSDIKSQWENAGKHASNLGSEMHSNIEFMMNARVHPLFSQSKFEFSNSNVEQEMRYFYSFCSTYFVNPYPLIPHRTEWVIFDEELLLAGSIDMLFKSYGPLPTDPMRSHPEWTVTKLSKHKFKDDEERYWIFDWKRAKEIKTSYKFKNVEDKYIKLENSFLENCDYDKYSLQLNIYRYILEKNYGIKIAGMVLVDIHPNYPNYKTFDVPFLDTEINLIIDKHKSSNKPRGLRSIRT